MNKKTGIIIVSILVVVVLLAVLFFVNSGNTGSSDQADSGPATEEPAGSTTPAAGSEATEELTASTDAAEKSGSGAATETPTIEAAPVARARVNLNLRQGPSVDYAIVGKVTADDEVTVVGRNEDSSWLVAETDEGQVWLSGQPDFVEVDQAALAKLPVVEAPAPPYDAGNPKVRAILEEIPLVVWHEGSFTCASHAGLNHLLPDVVAGNVIGPHSGDFVYGNDNVLFEVNNGTFQLIKENSVARFENGEKYLSLAKTLQLFASGDIVWNGEIGTWPGRGVTGCDLSVDSQ